MSTQLPWEAPLFDHSGPDLDCAVVGFRAGGRFKNPEGQLVKFMFSEKATKIDEIFTLDLTLCSKCKIDGEDLVVFCGLLRKHKL